MELIDKLCNYILDHELLSEQEVSMIKVCNDEILQIAPTDRPQLFRKEERLIRCSQDLSWCTYSLKLKSNKLTDEYRKLRDPKYTILVRQGRPSAAAIETELRYTMPEIYEMDEKMRILDNIIEFLGHLDLSIERYLYMLRDKLRYNE